MSTLSDDVRTLSAEAYIYLHPLATMEATRRQMVNTPAGAKPAMGPPDEFHHLRQFPAAGFRAVVRPNFDTLYSTAWIDLSGGPVAIHAPDTDDRYFMLPMLDMWTDVFANPGKRTTGTEARDFVLVGPDEAGIVKPDAAVTQAPTPWVWIIGRTQTNGPADYEAVHAVQDGFRVEPLSPRREFEVDPGADITTEPLRIVNGMAGAEFFAYASVPLATNPPHATDNDVLARIARLGIIPGSTFDPARFSAGELEELEAGVADAKAKLKANLPRIGTKANGWTVNTETIGVYGNDYLKRAVIAQVGLGANPPGDAIYPLLLTDADGAQPDGDLDYVIHFDACHRWTPSGRSRCTTPRASRSATRSTASRSATATRSSTTPTARSTSTCRRRTPVPSGSPTGCRRRRVRAASRCASTLPVRRRSTAPGCRRR
jgi:hypothetical protein